MTPSKEWIKTIVFLFAGVLLICSLLTGNDAQDLILKWTSISSSIVILLVLLFDKVLWKLPIINIVTSRTGHPDISGTWKGTLNYDRDADGQPGSIDMYISISQSFSTIEVRGYVSTSNSHTITARLNSYAANRLILEYAYRTEPPDGTHDRNRITDGLAKLTLIGIPVTELEGSYFTNRNGGTGRMIFTEWNQSKSDSFKQASSREFSKR
tara:strand:+ start:222 stop:854 length:633 start_codon:yes stop_codon:yes gene_type:complete